MLQICLFYIFFAFLLVCLFVCFNLFVSTKRQNRGGLWPVKIEINTKNVDFISFLKIKICKHTKNLKFSDYLEKWWLYQNIIKMLKTFEFNCNSRRTLYN